MDENARQAFVCGQALQLKPKEYELLSYLMRNANIMLSREQILTQVWGTDYNGGDRTVDIHISHLRKKLGDYADFIQTASGYGYKFEVMVATTSLQPVDEAVETLRHSTIYIVMAAVGLSILFSLLIARQVARPLIQEIKREKKTVAMRRQFLTNASHELKTPISIVSGFAESLADGIITDENEREEYARTIQDEAGKMGKLVKDMLDLSMLQNVDMPIIESEISLDGVLLRTLNRFTPLAVRKEIRIEQNQITACSIKANEVQIETVFGNLIGNAIHHTPAGKSIYVRLPCNESEIRFEIENEGEPIPEEMLDRIWESFFRIDQARNREEGRYGLGLSIVKEIVEKHKGTVGVRNTAIGVLFFIVFRTRV